MLKKPILNLKISIVRGLDQDKNVVKHLLIDHFSMYLIFVLEENTFLKLLLGDEYLVMELMHQLMFLVIRGWVRFYWRKFFFRLKISNDLLLINSTYLSSILKNPLKIQIPKIKYEIIPMSHTCPNESYLIFLEI